MGNLMGLLRSSEPPEAVATSRSETDGQSTSIWQNKRFRIFAGVAVALVVIVLLVVIALIVFQSILSKEEPQCSVQLKKNMDLTIDPCVDFYKYACGGWHAIESVKNSNREMSFLSSMREQVKKRIMDILLDSSNDGWANYFRVPKEYFAACKALGRNESFKDFFQLIQDVGIFPIFHFERYSSAQQAISEAMPKLAQLGAATMFITDVVETSRYSRLAIYAPSLNTWFNYNEEYKSWTVAVLELLGVLNGGFLQEMFKLEGKIMQIARDDNGPKNKKVAEASSSILQWVDFRKFLDVISKDTFNKEGMISNEDWVLLQNYVYLKEIPNSILPSGSIENPPLVNYAMKDLLKLTLALDARFPAFPGTKPDTSADRSEKCILETITEFQEVFSRIFADEMLRGTSISSIRELVSSIKIEYKSIIQGANWIFQPTRIILLQLLDDLEIAIGCPEFVLDDTHLYNLYNKVDTTSYFRAVVSLRRTKFRNKIMKLKNSNHDAWMWKDNFLNMNDDFANSESIVLPSFLFQLPIYNPEWPRSMMYGSLGTLTGHQLNHFPFREYREDFQTHPIFRQRMNCFQEQFNGYKFQDNMVNGSHTLYENMHDTDGLQASFKAHRKYISEYGEGPSIPGVYFTHDQLFFINFAQMQCQKIPTLLTEEALRRSEVPQEVRVKGTLHNTKEFSEAFGCKVGSPMNPEKKCYI